MTDNVQMKIEDREAVQSASAKSLQYPLDIGSKNESKYTIFQIYKYQKLQVNRPEFKESLGIVFLPIPPELNNTDSLNYEEYSAPVINAALNYGSADELSGAVSAMGSLGAILGAEIAKKIGGENLVNEASSRTGVAINPRNTNIFRSPSAREHRYTFKMIAKSEAESIAIRKIVNRFRYHAYPSAPGDEALYFSPDLFTISFKVGRAAASDKDSYLFHPLPSALIAMSVSYNGSSTPTFFQSSNAPVEVTMQLVFREMELDNKEKLQKRYGNA